MNQVNTTLPQVDVRVSYKTRTPFLYAELSGSYQGKPISIAVVETAPGQAETITGVRYQQTQKHDHGDRGHSDEQRTKELWHATIRTTRVNLAPLFSHDPKGLATTPEFKLTWRPDPEATPSVGHCEPDDIIFGRFPELHPVRLG